jgi:hypothetical protein
LRISGLRIYTNYTARVIVKKRFPPLMIQCHILCF